MSVGKALTSGRPVAGDEATFELDVTNRGPSEAAGVTVTDQLPSEIDPATATAGTDAGSCAVGASGLVSCELGTLPPSGPVRINVTGRLTQGLGTTLTNTATVSSSTADPAVGNNTSTIVGAVVGESADLSVGKTGPATVTAGGTVSWAVKVTNNGPSAAREVVVADPLPDGITSGTMTVDGGATCQSVTSCSIGTIGTGESVSLTVTGILPADFALPSISNGVRVSSPTPDPDARNNDSSVASAVVTSADLGVIKSVTPNPLVPGGAATYTLTVTNTGPSDALAAVATDPLPEGLTVRGAGPSSSQGGCRLLGRTVSCDLGTIGAAGAGGAGAGGVGLGGGTATITIPVTVDPGYAASNLVNSATVSSSTPDSDPANNTGSNDAAVAGTADLTLTKTGPTTLLAGEPLSWTIAVVNAGPSVAQNVLVTDPIPAGIQGISVSATHGGCVLAGAVVSCDIGSLAAGDVARIQIFLTAVVDPGFAGSSIVNTATVSSTTAEPNPEPNAPDGRTATVTTAVSAAADLAVSKTPTTATVTPGQRASWTITVLNAGPSTARDVELAETIPGGLTGVSFTDTAGAAVNCPDAVCQLGEELPGVENAVVITVSGLLDPGYDGSSLTEHGRGEIPHHRPDARQQ